jgi:hypothetical protein
MKFASSENKRVHVRGAAAYDGIDDGADIPFEFCTSFMIFAFLLVSLQLWGASLGIGRPVLSLGAGPVSTSSASENTVPSQEGAVEGTDINRQFD